MEKVKISSQAFPYPMPMTIVSAVVAGKVNHMAVAWVTRVNNQPPLLGVALGRHHHTNKGIRETGEFGVSIPSAAMLAAVDYAGLASGAKIDKSSLFAIFYGSLARAPLIKECPVNIACRLVQTIEFPTNELFVGEIVEAYCGKEFVTKGIPDPEKLTAYSLTMPDNRYWALGRFLGRAWSIGKDHNKQSR
jgi:flavin reductase (DIM6/NTAB) family NADH-FMN oxidoreductase RutF